MIGQFIGNYRVIRQIGEGGMGEVFEAVHEQIKRRAAVKILNQIYSKNAEMCQRFFNEALAVNVIQHASIVGVFESGRLPDGRAFIVMEYLDGESLRKRILREGPLPEAEALRLTRQAASALAAAHDKNIIHRDLKSENVMLVPDPEVSGNKRVKLLDFGIAKIASEHQANVKTKDGVIMGTPEYMSPEQWMSSNNADAKSDVYALGVMLFEMLSGQYPFPGNNSNQIMVQHLYDEPRPLNEVAPSVSPEVSNMVGRMLNKTRAMRPSMKEVVAEIESLSNRQAVMAARTVAARVVTPAAVASAKAVAQPGSFIVAAPVDPTVQVRASSMPKLEQAAAPQSSREAKTMIAQEDETRMASAKEMRFGAQPADYPATFRDRRTSPNRSLLLVLALLACGGVAAGIFFFLHN